MPRTTYRTHSPDCVSGRREYVNGAVVARLFVSDGAADLYLWLRDPSADNGRGCGLPVRRFFDVDDAWVAARAVAMNYQRDPVGAYWGATSRLMADVARAAEDAP